MTFHFCVTAVPEGYRQTFLGNELMELVENGLLVSMSYIFISLFPH